jgi:ATP-dependent RNA helicase DeaD
MTRFEDMGLSDETLSALEAMGFEEATPVQAATIPLLMAGRDVIGQAQTGTGKTAAFGVPLVEAARAGRRGLVLTPTRELAQQVQREIQAIGKGSPVDVVCLIGGARFGDQARALERHPNATLVATPGRILDHLEKGTLRLDALQIFVLDEADEMLSMGFQDELEAIVARLPTERQTVLFTATLAPAIERLAKKALRNPETVRIGKGPTTSVAQYFAQVKGNQRPLAVQHIMEAENPRATLLFARTRMRVDELVELLRGVQADGLHGGMQQAQRDGVMKRFRSGQTKILVATDVAARGLDVDEIDLVLHDELAGDADTYVHRMGRTGRAGRTGTSIVFVGPGKIGRLNMIRSVSGKLKEYVVPDEAALADVRMARAIQELDEVEVVPAAHQALREAHAQGKSTEELVLKLLSERLTAPAPEPVAVVHETTGIALKVGTMDDVRAGAIMGVLCNAGGLRGEDVGRIDILERMSVVEVPGPEADRVCENLARVRLSGRPLLPRIADDWRFKAPLRR